MNLDMKNVWDMLHFNCFLHNSMYVQTVLVLSVWNWQQSWEWKKRYWNSKGGYKLDLCLFRWNMDVPVRVSLQNIVHTSGKPLLFIYLFLIINIIIIIFKSALIIFIQKTDKVFLLVAILAKAAATSSIWSDTWSRCELRSLSRPPWPPPPPPRFVQLITGNVMHWKPRWSN